MLYGLICLRLHAVIGLTITAFFMKKIEEVKIVTVIARFDKIMINIIKYVYH